MDDGISAALDDHIRGVRDDTAAGKPCPKGGGQTWRQGDVTTRVGRFPDGRYYADVCYRVEEGFDDDFGSRTCSRWCPLQGRPHEHCHRTAETLEGLLDAQTLPGGARYIP